MKVGDKISAARGGWSFGGEVADTFVSHVERSVPFYHEGHDLICELSDFFCPSNSVCYELGTSTGQLISKLARHNKHKNGVRWIGIDSEEPMVVKAKQHCKDLPSIELFHDDILLFPYEPADMFVSYYVIQFVHPRHRQQLINMIYEKLNWGGAFLWFEKVRGADARFQDIATNIYTQFKLNNGFSTDEIINKSNSLKGAMEPFSTQGNIDMLRRAGFQDVMTVFKYVCFEGFLAIK